MPNLNDHLTELEFQLEKHPGTSQKPTSWPGAAKLRAASRWGDDRYQDGYGDARRDVADARLLTARDAEEKAARGG